MLHKSVRGPCRGRMLFRDLIQLARHGPQRCNITQQKTEQPAVVERSSECIEMAYLCRLLDSLGGGSKGLIGIALAAQG